MLNSVLRGRTKINFEMTGYDELVENATSGVKHLILAFFACILFLGSCILCTTDIHPQAANGMPLVAAAGMIFSIALAIYTVRKMTKKK